MSLLTGNVEHEVGAMRDRRSVDELTIEELEHILMIRKREARMERLRRFESTGRRPIEVPIGEGADEEIDDDEDVEFESFLQTDQEKTPRKERTLRDHLLLAVELTAALAIFGILIYTAVSVWNLNQETAAHQAEQLAELPTPSPTPLLRAVVLPGGHTPPTAPGGARPNFDEVPSYLRPQVEQSFYAPVVQSTPLPGYAVRISIPAINIDAQIVQGTGWEQLKQGVGQQPGTAIPGAGNTVLAAHNDIYGELFRNLDQLAPGDEIIVYNSTSQQFVFSVSETYVVEPTDVQVMDPTQEAIVTLISCYPYLDNSQRIIVIGTLDNP